MGVEVGYDGCSAGELGEAISAPQEEQNRLSGVGLAVPHWLQVLDDWDMFILSLGLA